MGWLPYQQAVLAADTDIVFLGGGVGCGKTEVGSTWAYTRALFQPQGGIGLVAANTYTQLRDATLRNLYRSWERLGIRWEPRELPRGGQPMSLWVATPYGPREVLCRSLDNYEALAGVELSWAWLDEAWQTKREAIEIVLARLRDQRLPKTQLLLTTTLDDPTTWMHEMFVDKRDERRMTVVYARTADNTYLPPDYLDKLRSLYSERMFARMCEARWVVLSEGQVYHAFDRDRNVRPVEFDPHLPVLWSHDFNVGEGKPMSSCLCQVRREPTGKVTPAKDGVPAREETVDVLAVFDEIILDGADTGAAAAEFASRYPGVRATIYGDAAGRSKDSRSKTTDYLILSQAGHTEQDVPRANPPIRDRHNCVNALLRDAAGQVRLWIDPRCKTLIKGLETVTVKSGASYVEEETREQHVTTALGYLVARRFPMRRFAPPTTTSGNWK